MNLQITKNEKLNLIKRSQITKTMNKKLEGMQGKTVTVENMVGDMEDKEN